MVVLVIFFMAIVDAKDCFPEYRCLEWGECNGDGIQQRSCVDDVCGLPEIVERRFCSGMDCDLNIQCSDWTICNYGQKIGDLVKGKINLKGYKERACLDLGGCVVESVERELCTLAVPVETKKTVWCSEEYVEIFDPRTNNLVSRISEKEIFGDLKRVDISFVTSESSEYCGYCFDGVKNFDETGVDCGGLSCPACTLQTSFFDWSYWATLISWIVFGFLFFFFLFIGISKSEKSFREISNSFLKSLRPSSSEEARLKEEKISEFFSRIFGNRKQGDIVNDDFVDREEV
jgi:hypothetical protein